MTTPHLQVSSETRQALDTAAIWITGVGMVLGVVLPRSMAVIFFLFCGAILLRIPLLGAELNVRALIRNRITQALLAFYGFALLSFLWAYDPPLAFKNGLFGVATSLVAMATYAVLAGSPALFSRVARAAKIAVLISAAALLIDMATNEQIRLVIGGALGYARAKNYALDNDVADLTRGLSIVLLFYIAAMAKPLSSGGDRNALVSTAALGSLVAAAIAAGVSQTAQLAAIVSLGVFAVARFVPKTATGLVAAGWIAACMLIVPAALWAKSSPALNEEMTTSPVLQHASPGARIEILNAYAIRVHEAPYLGQGANSSRVLGPLLDEKRMLAHPHNAYMQVWYELGLAGAVLFTMAGLVILRRIATLAPAPSSAALTGFAAIASIIAPSYGMWESWFVEAIAFAGLLIAAGVTHAGRGESVPP